MPFIVTEPQRIEGTQLGYAVYPYQFSFEDHIWFEKKYDRKLMIFKLKDSPFNEVEKVLHEDKFLFAEEKRGYIDGVLKNFVCKNGQYVTNFTQMGKYFTRQTNFNLAEKHGAETDKVKH